MNNKPKNSIKTSLKFILVLFAVIYATHPSLASAKRIQFDLALADVNDEFVFSNSSIHSTLLSAQEEGQNEEIDTPEDIEKAKRLDAYFEKRNMPLAGYGIEFVRAANKYDLDWRLIAAIGVRESSGGKHMMNNNPFGWGSAKIKFADFSEAIDVVSWNLGGFNPNTERYYKNPDMKKKLWYYNTSVVPTYTNEIFAIMNMF